MVKELPLTKGYVAIVEDEDFDWLSQWKWTAKDCGNTVYGMRKYRKGGRQFTISLHRQIMGNPEGMEVDHEDRNGLNNRRSNLRVVSHKANAYNAKMNSRNTSGFRGVHRNPTRQRWVARIMHEGKSRTLGTFDDIVEAAKAYDQAAREWHGPTAFQNFPSDAV